MHPPSSTVPKTPPTRLPDVLSRRRGGGAAARRRTRSRAGAPPTPFARGAGGEPDNVELSTRRWGRAATGQRRFCSPQEPITFFFSIRPRVEPIQHLLCKSNSATTPPQWPQMPGQVVSPHPQQLKRFGIVAENGRQRPPPIFWRGCGAQFEYSARPVSAKLISNGGARHQLI